MIPARGWRPLLRLAWRDAVRARGRSVLVLVMIALPVLGVTTADVLLSTTDVSGVESLDRRLGAADAQVSFQPGSGRVAQRFDPDDGSASIGDPGPDTEPSLSTISAALGRDVEGIQEWQGSVRVRTEKGYAESEAAEIDLADPLARGLFELTSGTLPARDGEAVINAALAERGFAVGDRLELADGPTVTVVGVVESSTTRSFPMVWGTPGTLGLPRDGMQQVTWLVRAGPVAWSDVLALNDGGALVLSREVVTNPPPDSAIPAEVRGWDQGAQDALVAVVVLVAVMALLEVVLLAGPAFAVGARRQSRSLALMAATGGTPAQARRVVLSSGLVLGGMSAIVGVVGGIGLAWLLLPAAQHFSDTWLGPFDVRWRHLLGIAALGLASALLAALVPAWIASRQDVVAVLAGRRGDRPPSLRSPILGVVLVAAGVAGSAYGAVTGGNAGAYAIAASAIVAVLGMILLVPLVVVGVARLARRLPLTLRFAARDAARHRTRTVPAVAAVAATVAGVVALGIANASDQEEYRATYVPSLAMGKGVLSAQASPREWDRLGAELTRYAPGVEATPVRGLSGGSSTSAWTQLNVKIPGGALLSGYGSSLGSSDLVASTWPTGLPRVAPADAARAARALADGGVVLFSDTARPDADVRLVARRYPPEGGGGEKFGPVTAHATFVRSVAESAPAQSVMSPELLARLGLPDSQVGLYLDGTISQDQQTDLEEAIAGVTPSAWLYVERGYDTDQETLIIFLVLGGLGAVLMLGGTLTATFLALSDARPDLATLSAVGAAPRTRRGVAASYALVVGLVGAVLGAALGLIPGIAVTWPLTGNSWATHDVAGNPLPTHYLAIPWPLVLTVVVVLPLLTALVVWLCARPRLPLVARLD